MNSKFDYNAFEEVIDMYINNYLYISGLDDIEKSKINQNLKLFINNTQKTKSIKLYHVRILNSINYLVDTGKKIDNRKKDDKKFMNRISNLDYIPEEKFEKIEQERLKTVGQIKELEEKLEKRESEFNKVSELLEKSSKLEENYKNAEASLLEKIKTDKSSEFWEKQHTQYTIKYYIYLIVSILFASIMLVVVYNYLIENPIIVHNVINVSEIGVEKQELITFPKELGIQELQVWKYGFLILVTTLAIWLLRILVKITLSNYHLSVDANERVIMIKTYIAFIKDGKGFSGDDNKIILDNIFRPTNFGIIKDESSITILDLVNSFKSK
jgi:hypothetical protein